MKTDTQTHTPECLHKGDASACPKCKPINDAAREQAEAHERTRRFWTWHYESLKTDTQTDKQTAHSPLPWHHDDADDDRIYDNTFRCIADNLQPDNARLIVQAVCDYIPPDIYVARTNYLKAQADKLAEALRRFTEAYRMQSDHDLECAEAEASKALYFYDNERQ